MAPGALFNRGSESRYSQVWSVVLHTGVAGVEAQSALVLHWTQPAVALQTWPVVAQSVELPAVQVLEALQVPAEVNTVPEQLAAVQSELALHSTQVPAVSPEPHTFLPAWPSAVQSVPAAAGVKLGARGVPVHAGVVRQTVLDTGRSVESSTDVVLPEPLHTIFWQSPVVCPVGTIVLVPG